MELKIEKNIPIPMSRNDHRQYIRLAEKMEIGDSIFVEKLALKETLRTALKKVKFLTRTKKEKNGWRVWRVE